ncbi:hypothetical protein EVAR_47821_1 [Eumeta japonica]|uniref:Uncharacterized protein n=1 Tax=Eumeta variegata TaxID=151549 RepID=A0A4C1Z0D2_EUMVA|nr:hypothetical protein EVAR_47821_1 [Eumeta japonica]
MNSDFFFQHLTRLKREVEKKRSELINRKGKRGKSGPYVGRGTHQPPTPVFVNGCCGFYVVPRGIHRGKGVITEMVVIRQSRMGCPRSARRALAGELAQRQRPQTAAAPRSRSFYAHSIAARVRFLYGL